MPQSSLPEASLRCCHCGSWHQQQCHRNICLRKYGKVTLKRRTKVHEEFKQCCLILLFCHWGQTSLVYFDFAYGRMGKAGLAMDDWQGLICLLSSCRKDNRPAALKNQFKSPVKISLNSSSNFRTCSMMFWQISKQLEAFYSFVYTLVAKLGRVSSRYEIKPLTLQYTWWSFSPKW